MSKDQKINGPQECDLFTRGWQRALCRQRSEAWRLGWEQSRVASSPGDPGSRATAREAALHKASTLARAPLRAPGTPRG